MIGTGDLTVVLGDVEVDLVGIRVLRTLQQQPGSLPLPGVSLTLRLKLLGSVAKQVGRAPRRLVWSVWLDQVNPAAAATVSVPAPLLMRLPLKEPLQPSTNYINRGSRYDGCHEPCS
jgi:hypothetical protein